MKTRKRFAVLYWPLMRFAMRAIPMLPSVHKTSGKKVSPRINLASLYFMFLFFDQNESKLVFAPFFLPIRVQC